jgi:hypothetical protein
MGNMDADRDKAFDALTRGFDLDDVAKIDKMEIFEMVRQLRYQITGAILENQVQKYIERNGHHSVPYTKSVKYMILPAGIILKMQ